MKKYTSRLYQSLLSLCIVFPMNYALAVDTIEMDIISAPVVANGLVASEPTEINVVVRQPSTPADRALDPQVFGFQVPAGGRLEVELTGSYIANPDFEGYLPARHIILTTGPQNPIKPNTEAVSGGNWHVESPDANTINVVPNAGSGDNGLEGTRAAAIGFKVIHVRPNTNNRSHSGTPFYNGHVGSTGVINVRIFDGSDQLVATGTSSITFPASVGKQVHLSSLATRDDNSVNSNTLFQRVNKNTKLTATSLPPSGSFQEGGPYAPQFLLFEDFGSHDPSQFPTGGSLPNNGDESFIPFPGISDLSIKYSNDAKKAFLISNNNEIGQITITGPDDGNSGNGSFKLMRGKATISQQGNGTLLFVPVKVGNSSGAYDVTVELNGGNSATNTTIVE